MEAVLKAVQKTEKTLSRVIGRLFEFDKQVEVAIGSILAASDRPEYIQPLDRESLAI